MSEADPPQYIASKLLEAAMLMQGCVAQINQMHIDMADLAGCVTAALHIHRPCHTGTSCVRRHHEDQSADCVGCGYNTTGGFEMPIGWPCPTARALGAT